MAVIGYTLGRYLSTRFLKSMLGMFATVVVLILTVDFVELMRRAGDIPGVSPTAIMLLTLFRTPAVTEQVMPFAVLFGSMAAMLAMSRKLELVITRSAGVSVWEFLQPPIMVALALGVFMVTVYNPVSARLKELATEMESAIFGKGTRALAREMWIRQRSVDGQAIIRAMGTNAEGTRLTEVTFFTFGEGGDFQERIEAKAATIRDGYWDLEQARVISASAPPEQFDAYVVASNLLPEQVRQSFVPASSVPFWELPALVEQTERAGLDATRYRLQYQALLARPLLLIAMVIIASTVSLRFFRMGGVAKMVLGGVAAGFMLYVVKQLVEDLGTNGFLSVTAAAWIPATVATLVGGFVLLHQEDG